MDIKKLQEELIEKILLIPNLVEGDDISNSERALEIINKLGKDHINDVIITNSGRFTALDYVIIADSQGNNPILSERPRKNNMMLVELENAIKNVEGKTLEELELVQIETNTHRAVPNDNTPAENQITPLHYAVMNGNREVVRRLLEREADVNVENSDSNVAAPLNSVVSRAATPLHYAAENGNLEMVRSLIELHASTNLEGATVQSSTEGRGNSL